MGFMDKVKETAKSADEKLGNRIDIDKYESKIRDEEREIDKICTEVGKKTVETLRADGKLSKKDYEDFIQKIEEAERRIEEYKEKIKEIKAKKEE